MTLWKLVPLAGVVLASLGHVGAQASQTTLSVAGTKPDQRPADAPVVHELEKNGAWYDHALTGVDSPYPYSLRFLEDQGAWFTPFTRPGMTGPYDIRGWHQSHSEISNEETASMSGATQQVVGQQ